MTNVVEAGVLQLTLCRHAAWVGCQFGVAGALCGTWSVAGVKRICRCGKLDLLNRSVIIGYENDMNQQGSV